MIEQLCIREIIRGRNVWMLFDCSDPGLEDLLSLGEHEISKASECWHRGTCLTVASDRRNPPDPISEGSPFAVLGGSIIRQILQDETGRWQGRRRDRDFGVTKIFPV